MEAQAVVWTGPREVQVQSIEIEPPESGEILIEHAISLVSPGTEAEWLASPESHIVLGTTFPFVPGYSRVGRIVEVGEGVSGWNVGDRVVAPFDRLGRPLGAHATHSVARAADVDEIPESVSFEQAAFFLLGQTAGFVVALADVQPGDAVAIVGQGPIGNLAVQFAREAQAARIVALDLVESRRGMARAAGATDALDPTDDEALSHLLEESGGITKTIDLSGSPRGTDLAIRLAGPLGTVILSTGFGGRMELDYGAIFVKGLHLIGGFVNSRPALARSATQDYLRLLSEGRLNVSSLVSPAFPPAQAPAVFSRVLERDRSLVAPLFDWREA